MAIPAALALAATACLPSGGNDHKAFWPAAPDLRRDAIAPVSRDVRPVRVVSTAAGVTNAGALVGQGKGPVTLTRPARGPDPVVVLDYGRDVEGIPYFKVGGGTGSPTLSASYAEALPFLTPKGDNQILTGAFDEDLLRYDTYPVPNKTETLRNERIQGAERFQMIRLSTPGTVRLTGVGIDFSPPLPTPRDRPGYFVSSSADLNRIWNDSAYTTQLDSLPQNAEPANSTPPLIVDGAKRDRNVWGGDLLIPAQTVYYSSGAGEYVKGSLDLLGRTPLPSGAVAGHLSGTKSEFWSEAYSMDWVAVLTEYYRYTGDTRFVRDHWPEVRRELAWNASHVDRRGLLITNGKTWHPVDGQDFHGAVTADNAMYFHILGAAADVASDLGFADEAAGYRTRAASLKNAVDQVLFDRRTGDYDVSDTRRGQTGQDADALAVLYGLAPPDRVKGVLAAMRRGLWTPKGPRVVPGECPARGLVVPDRRETARDQPVLVVDGTVGTSRRGRHVRRPRPAPYALGPDGRSAQPVLHGSGVEVLNPAGQPGLSITTSLSHAWGTGPASGLSGYVLGVRPASAGFAKSADRPAARRRHVGPGPRAHAPRRDHREVGPPGRHLRPGGDGPHGNLGRDRRATRRRPSGQGQRERPRGVGRQGLPRHVVDPRRPPGRLVRVPDRGHGRDVPRSAPRPNLRGVSFSVFARKVRDTRLPYGRRVSALRSCVQMYRPIGFHASLSFLEELAGRSSVRSRCYEPWTPSSRAATSGRRTTGRTRPRAAGRSTEAGEARDLRTRTRAGARTTGTAPVSRRRCTPSATGTPASPPTSPKTCVTECLASGGPLTAEQRRTLTARVTEIRRRLPGLYDEDRVAFFHTRDLLKVARLSRSPPARPDPSSRRITA